MKKNEKFIFLLYRKMQRTLSVCILITLFLFAGSPQVYSIVNTKQQVISIELENATLEQVIWEIRKLTDLVIMYGTDDVKRVKNLNVRFYKKPVLDVLNYCIKDSNLELLLDSDAIIIKKSKAKQQNKEISGTVVDSDGKPLPGVSVVVKGTQKGTATDINGRFVLPYNKGMILVVSFMGMETQEIEVKEQKSVRVEMKEKRKEIEEVMVVAYGTSKKKSFTGSAVKVDDEKIERKNVSEISKALTGEVPGVAVVSTSGQPGINADIYIRGFGSVNAEQKPLYILDGVPFNGDLSALSPSDIDSYTILKDATATAIYGSRGANGVILINTKRGKKGATQVEATVKYGINARILPDYEVISSPEEFVEISWESLRNYLICEAVKNEKRPFGEIWTRDYEKANNFTSSNMLFNPDKNGFNTAYNMWDVDPSKLIDPATGKVYPGVVRKYTPEDWADNVFRTGYKTEASVKMSGGNDKTSFFSSLSFLSDEGYYIESDFMRLSTRLNVDHKVNKWLKFNSNISYAYLKYNRPGQSSTASNNGFLFCNTIPPIYPVFERDDEGKKIKDEIVGGYRYDYGFEKARRFLGGINPAGAVRLDQDRNITHQVSYNGGANVNITSDVTFISNFGMQYSSADSHGLTNPFYGDAKGMGRLNKDHQNYFSYTWNQLLNYKHSYGLHNIEAFIAHEITDYENTIDYAFKDKLARYNIPQFNNAIIMQAIGGYLIDYFLESFFAQAKYDYDEKYFIHGTVRRDGSSRFQKDNRWGNFYSIGAAWVMSKEDFILGIPWIDDLKVKLSYGELGNQDIGNYPTYDNYAVQNMDDEISFVFNYKGNSDLTWERSKTINTGVEFKIFNKLRGEVEYFNKLTDNLLFNKAVSPSLGYSKIPVNDGELLNKGIEFNLNADIIKSNNLNFSLNLNGAHYKNEMLTMPMEGATGKPKHLDVHGIYAYAEGHSLYDFYMREWAGVDAEDGQGLWNCYYFINDKGEEEEIPSLTDFENGKFSKRKVFIKKTKDYEDATKKFVGKSAIPDLSGALGLNFSYKNFNLTTQLLYSFGGWAYDYVYAGLMGNDIVGKSNWHADMRNRWQKPGDVTDIPRLNSNMDIYTNSVSTRFLVKSDYISLNNIKLTYEISQSLLDKLNIKGMSLSLSGDNLWLSTKRKGYTPTTNVAGSTNEYSYTPLSTVVFGVKINL